MTSRDSFSAEEWQTLQFAPFWTWSAVAEVDGMADESERAVLVNEIFDAPRYKEPLVREVLGSVGLEFGDVMERYFADSRTIEQGLGEVADILDRKASPDEAQNFKGAMLSIGMEVAEASGSFPDRLSEEERRTLVLVARSFATVATSLRAAH